ncbi:hypothetical protein CCP3SC15_1820004 [Gammaproteobacteria bacterium]
MRNLAIATAWRTAGRTAMRYRQPRLAKLYQLEMRYYANLALDHATIYAKHRWVLEGCK